MNDKKKANGVVDVRESASGLIEDALRGLQDLEARVFAELRKAHMSPRAAGEKLGTLDLAVTTANLMALADSALTMDMTAPDAGRMLLTFAVMARDPTHVRQCTGESLAMVARVIEITDTAKAELLRRVFASQAP